MYAPGRGQHLQYGNASSSGAGPQSGTTRGQSTAFPGGFQRKSVPYAPTSAVKLGGPALSPSPGGVAPRSISRGIPQTPATTASQRPHSRGASGPAVPGPTRARGNSISRNNAVQGRNAIYSTGSASTTSGPNRSPLQSQRMVQPSPHPSPNLSSVADRGAQLSQRSPPATPSRNEWRGTRPLAQNASSKLAGGYPASASKKQTPATPTLNHRTPLENHRTPATSSQGSRTAIARNVGSPTASRLRSPAESRSGISASGSAATPSLIAGRTPKAPLSSPTRSQAATDHSAEGSSYREQRPQRGGPFLEESNVVIKCNAPEAAAPPNNYVARFYHEASLNAATYREFALQPRMDVAQYWEKRRVQNVLRRVLEAIQEGFNLDSDSLRHDFSTVFNRLMQNAGLRSTAAEDGLQEAHLVSVLDKMGLWPPELSPDDRTEIFHALLVPSVANARAALTDGKPMRSTLTARLFQEGFTNVPFNLPDFPVTSQLIPKKFQTAVETDRNHIAEAMARVFSLEKTGIDKVKDFFMCGLLSLEEIQIGLPFLVPHLLVQDAVKRVIQCGAPLMSAEEWYRLVLAVRTPQACGQAVAEDSVVEDVESTAMVSREAREAVLSSPLQSPSSQSRGPHASVSESMYSMPNLGTPATQHREIRETPSVQFRDVSEVISPQKESSPLASPKRQHDVANIPSEGRIESEMEGSLSKFRACLEPAQTEPLPCRNVRNEEPVNFSVSGSANSGSGGVTRVVNWNTAVSSPDQGVVGHQADVGAGSRHSWGTRGFKQECAEAATKSSSTHHTVLMPGGADPVAWINLELHHECGGPYLAHAFVRCCALFMESRQRRGFT